MANTKIMLMAEANKLGIEGYRQMSEADLTAAIAAAKKGGKGKTAAAPAKGKGKTAPAAKGKTTASKGKTATSGKGKTTPAKAATTASKPKGKTTKASPAKSTAQKSSPAKGKAAQGAQAKRTPARGRGKQPVGAVRLDNKSIDWKAESNVGRSGKRKDVMDALRKFKGDKTKVFNLLAPKAKTYYKGKSKHEAERTLVWLIGRVAFDFAMATGQHTPGARAAYGTSEAPQDIRRRERRAEASGTTRRAARGTGRKTTAAKKTGSTKGKGAAKKTTAARGKGKGKR